MLITRPIKSLTNVSDFTTLYIFESDFYIRSIYSSPSREDLLLNVRLSPYLEISVLV